MSSTPSSSKPNGGSVPSTPRWVKVLGIIFITVVVVFVALHLAGIGLGGHLHHMP